ncbi:hypothetical protein [Streptomyces goshikiensis]
MTTSTPAGLIARYKTAGGSAVDVRPHPALVDHILAGCHGCHLANWSATGDAWHDTEAMRSWAQQHADECSAVPLPT